MKIIRLDGWKGGMEDDGEGLKGGPLRERRAWILLDRIARFPRQTFSASQRFALFHASFHSSFFPTLLPPFAPSSLHQQSRSIGI